VQAFNGDLVWAAYLVGIAAVFDFFDGFAARMLGVSSPIGKDLDSLADMVTFGVVPGIVMYKMLIGTLDFDKEGFDFLDKNKILCYFPFIITIFSAVRLAKFNNDKRQSESFIGLNTPSNSILICSIPLIVNWDTGFSFERYQSVENILNPYIICVLSLVLSLLLVSEIPFFALKFKSFGWKGNEIRYVFLGLSLILLITLKFIGIPLVIFLYILLSVINNLFFKTKSPI
jgi:CDP-diacylglycerol--serine O-phosphatidyltransferase